MGFFVYVSSLFSLQTQLAVRDGRSSNKQINNFEEGRSTLKLEELTLRFLMQLIFLCFH
jgi:hypothetical protein